MNKKYKVKQSRVLLRRLWSYLRPFLPVLIVGVIANIAFSAIDAGFTYMLKPFLDKGLIMRDAHFIRWVPIIIFVGIVLRSIVNSTAAYCMTWVARQVVKVFRQKVFKQLLSLPASFYDRSTAGQLLSKLIYDVEQISKVSADFSIG